MELHQIRYFLAIAEHLNFTRAAEHCGVSQPSLTRAIKRLEDELGGQLVRRERNRTHLTQLGRMVKPRLEQALSLTEVARAEADSFARMSDASLTLGVMCTIGPGRLISLIDHLRSNFPQLSLSLRTSSGRDIVEWLLAGEIDVGIVGMPDYPDEVAVHDLYEERYMVAFPKNHRFTDMESVPLTELAGESYLRRLNCEYMDYFRSVVGDDETNVFEAPDDALKSLDVRHESEHENWIQSMIVAGMGCAVMPEHMLLNSELQMRQLVDPALCRTIGIATVRGRPHSPVVALFSELCRQMNWGSDAAQSTDT